MNIVAHNIGNCRYPGFSEFKSQNCLQNSSYCWSFPKSMRFNDGKVSLNPTMYNLPSIQIKRTTSLGIGERKTSKPRMNSCNPSPDAYNLRTDVDLNLLHHKGPTIAPRLEDLSNSQTKRFPGPGTYKVTRENLLTDIPIKLKSRLGFFYDDDLKKTKHCVSMQKYNPSTKLEQNLRYTSITFGVGGRTPNENLSVKSNPGPGYYKVPGCFDRGYRGKLVLN